MNNTIQVGFGRADITPEEYTTLAGFGNDKVRMCTEIRHRITGTCIAFEDADGSRVLFCTVDLLNAVYETVVQGARQAISAATGVPEDRIMVSVTHTHSAPSMYNWEDPMTNRYLTHYCKQMAKAAQEALADLSEAEISVGQRNLPRMAFVRRYINVDGVMQHIAPADDQLQVIRFARKDALDIVLVNWQAHVTFIGRIETNTELSPDYVGHMRNHVEGSLGCHCAFFQGGAGNQGGTSQIEGEAIIPNPRDDRFEASRVYGKLLADGVLATLEENMRPVNGGKVRMIRHSFDAQVDHTTDDMAPIAEKAIAEQPQFDDWRKLPAYYKQFGFNSRMHANMVRRRAKMPPTIQLELDTVAVGDISFATLPFEMFSSNCKFIKDHTPFEMTFVLAYSNGSHSYLADETGFEHDIYEVNTRKFIRGTAETLANTHVAALHQLKQA